MIIKKFSNGYTYEETDKVVPKIERGEQI